MPTLNLGIFDAYDNLVTNLNSGELKATVVNLSGNQKYTPSVTFSTTLSVKHGLFNISDLIVTAGPGTSSHIRFSTSLIDTENPSNTDGSITMSLDFRNCNVGEAFLDDGTCQKCEAGVGYLLQAPTSETA
jgi:hypothetical protein